MTKTETTAPDAPVADAPKKKAKAQGERALRLDPALLYVVKNKAHPLYNPSADLPVNPGMVDLMVAQGWLGGSIEARPATEEDVAILGEDEVEVGTLLVEDGRQRTPAAEKANKKRQKLGLDPILVRVFVNEGDDNVTSYVRTIGLNSHRVTKSVTQEAQEVYHLHKNLGMSLKNIAVLYGWESTDTVKNRLKFNEAAPEVKKAAEAGTITPSDAMRIVQKKLTPEQQVQALAKIPQKDPTKPKKRRSKADAQKAKAAAGPAKHTEKRRPTAHNLTTILDEIEDKTPAAYALRYALGLVSIKTAAKHLGLATDSVVYKHLLAREQGE